MWNSPASNTILYRKVKHKITNLVYPSLLTTLPLLLLITAILFFKLHAHVSKTVFDCWAAALLTTITCQAGLAVWFQKTKYSLKWDAFYYKLLIINAAVIGVLWGVASVMFMPDESIGQSYLILVLGIIAAGGVIYFTESFLAGSVYTTGVLLPLIATLFITVSPQNNPEIIHNLALGLVYYWIFLLAVNYYGSKLRAEIIVKNLQMKSLTEDLTSATEELEKLNSASNQVQEKHLLAQVCESPIQKTLHEYTDSATGADTQEILAIKSVPVFAFARRHYKGIAIFSIQINNYEDVKNKFGENTANLFLKAIAARLQNCNRATDIFARSEENIFTLLISEVLFGNEIQVVINRISKNFAADVIINDKKIPIDIRMGICLFPKDGENLLDLVKKSKIALFQLSSLEGSLKPNFLFYDEEKMGIELASRESI